MIYLYANRIRKVLKQISEKFWTVKIDEKLEMKIDNRYSKTLKGILIYITFTSIFIIGVILTPFILGSDRNLPYSTVYPFDWTVSPWYESLFLAQAVCDILIPVLVFGYDFLFFSLCFTLTAQYMCLQQVIEKLGTNDMKKIMEKIGFCLDEIADNQDDVAKLFIQSIVKQHVMLFR